MLLIMRMTNSRKIMGDAVNGRVINVLGWATTVAIFCGDGRIDLHLAAVTRRDAVGRSHDVAGQQHQLTPLRRVQRSRANATRYARARRRLRRV